MFPCSAFVQFLNMLQSWLLKCIKNSFHILCIWTFSNSWISGPLEVPTLYNYKKNTPPSKITSNVKYDVPENNIHMLMWQIKSKLVFHCVPDTWISMCNTIGSESYRCTFLAPIITLMSAEIHNHTWYQFRLYSVVSRGRHTIKTTQMNSRRSLSLVKLAGGKTNTRSQENNPYKIKY